MKAVKIVAALLLAYAAIVAIFESLLGHFQPQNEDTLVITTFEGDGIGHDRVLSRLDSDGVLYVAVNHWPRAWYRRALENPAVQVTADGDTKDYLAIPVADEEHAEIAAAHPIPTGVRALMGFAPRRFLRLVPAERAPAEEGGSTHSSPL